MEEAIKKFRKGDLWAYFQELDITEEVSKIMEGDAIWGGRRMIDSTEVLSDQKGIWQTVKMVFNASHIWAGSQLCSPKDLQAWNSRLHSPKDSLESPDRAGFFPVIGCDSLGFLAFPCDWIALPLNITRAWYRCLEIVASGLLILRKSKEHISRGWKTCGNPPEKNQAANKRAQCDFLYLNECDTCLHISNQAFSYLFLLNC